MTVRQRRAALNALTGLRIAVSRIQNEVYVRATGDASACTRFLAVWRPHSIKATHVRSSINGLSYVLVCKDHNDARRVAVRLRRALGAI